MPRWPYICGQAARSADLVSGTTTPNPLVGGSAACWDAGYRGDPEPAPFSRENTPPIPPAQNQGLGAVPPAGRHHCGIVVVVDFLNVLVRAFHASPPSPINGVRGMLDTIAGVIDRLSPEFLLFALDGGHVDRSRLYPDYKAHRGPKPPDLDAQIKLGEQALQALGWPSLRVAGWEADDVIASVATQLDDRAASVIVVSSDKDLVQLLGSTRSIIYHPWGGGASFREADAQKKFGIGSKQLGDYLALVGDASDGVPGVRGIGPKKAVELLASFGTLDQVLEAARCLRIPGAAGKALREHADAARLSRQLVTLRADLPIGAHWEQWPLAEPRGGWKDGLIKLGLGASAQRLGQRLSAGRDRSQLASHVDVEWIAVQSFVSSITTTAVSTTESPAPVTHSVGESVETVPVDVSLEKSLREKAAAIYADAVAARAHWGKPCANPYHPGTLGRAAFDAGTAGAPLDSIDLAAYDQNGKPITVRVARENPPPSPEPEAQPTTRSTLF